MEQVLIVIHLLVVIALIGVILLQRSDSSALGGLGGGGSGGLSGFMTGRGQANLLTRATAILAVIFFVVSLLLAVIAGNASGSKSVLDSAVPAPSAPAQTEAPAPPASGGVLDQLKQLDSQQKPAQ